MPRPDHSNRASVFLRARTILPLSRPPIDDGAISILGNRIRSIGRWKDLARHRRDRTVLDLGDVILLPGLVNAHCHLDYTMMAGELAPQRKFTDWLKLITANKSGLTFSDFAQSWINGAKMLVRTGTTTVGDIEMVSELLPEVWTTTPLRVISFLEMTGIKSGRPPREILHDALKVIASLPHGRCRAALSPHSPYSTAPNLLHLSAKASRKKRLRVATHVAESDQEFDMFAHARGDMYTWLARNGRDMSDCGLGTPVQHLERHGALHDNLLAIHVNYLGPGDAALLGKHNVHVVHCPRSHTYFKHRPFPIDELTAERVNICLGTDSLASVNKTRKRSIELSLFDEMRELASRIPTLPPATIIRMATINSALALGLAGKVGQLSPKAFADIIAIPHAANTGHSHEQVIHHRGDVAASMIDGKWVIPPPGFTTSA